MKPEEIYTEEILRDEKNIVLVTPEAKKQMAEAAKWHREHFPDSPQLPTSEGDAT